MKENLRGILFMLLAMVEFAIEDGVIKNLANTLLVSKILILTGILGALVFAIFAKIGKEAVYSKNMLSKIFLLRLLPTCLRHYFLCLPWRLFLYQWPPQSCTLFLSLRRWGLRSAGSKFWMAPLELNLRRIFGVPVIMQPGFGGFEATAILALLGAICPAVRDLVTRALKSELLGIFFLGKRPDTLTFLGAALVIASGLFSVLARTCGE